MMTEIFNNHDIVFWACALIGTVFFVLRMVAFGIASTDDGDVHHDGTTSEGDDVMHHTDNDDSYHDASHHKSSLKLFTTHSLSGFFMMFGWTGLACTQQLGYCKFTATLIAFGIGFVTMLCTALIFKSARILVSSGTRFDIRKTVGLVGTVYQRIPAHGFGKIQLEVDGITREILAQSLNHCTIDSFKIVKIVQTLDHEVVIVTEVTQ